MQRLANGDFDAFETLYDAYHRLVFGIGLRLLGDAASAEDLTQVVFLKVWANPSRFRGGALVAWLGRVTRNAGLDTLRQRATRSAAEIPANVQVDSPLEDEVFAVLEAERVRIAVTCLPTAERIPIEMGFFRGMTYRSVAMEIGRPKCTP